MEAAYLAGIIDGEGCIQAYELGSGRLWLELSISNTSDELMDALTAAWGGRVWTRQKPGMDVHIWSTGVTIAVPLLTAVLPFLIVKRIQAEKFLELAGLRASRKRDQQTKEARANLVAEIKRLKTSKREMVR